jgi:fructosamine-3-kinase
MIEAPIKHALAAAGLSTDVRSTSAMSGGCIHHVVKATLGDGMEVVAKLNAPDELAIFEEEAAGLRALADTQTVLVPRPLAVGVYASHAVLLMSHVRHGSATAEAWRSFGEELAALHAVDVGRRYGFEIDNHLGSTYQPNAWSHDWVDFNARYRLGYQIELAQEHERLSAGEVRRIETLIERLGDILPRRPKPALLHGDLWSGNALPSIDDGRSRIAVIDPACSIGDGWADIAMMRLFGGFAPECFEAYAGVNRDHESVAPRIAVYQLYHLLNHVNLFGRGYAGQAMNVVGQLGF